MKLKITTRNGCHGEPVEVEDDFVLADDVIAYKEGNFYDILRSSKSYCVGSCMGHIKVIIDNGEVVKWLYPMFESAAHPYEYIKLETINKWKKICQAFERRLEGSYQLIDTTFIGIK